MPARGAVDQDEPEREDGDPDRDVDEEDPVPVERVVRIPPRRTPIVPPPAATKPKTPIAFARSAGSVNSVTISDSATADTTAPPRPCTARAPTSSLRRREPAAERRQREERDPDQEQTAVAEEVAQPAAEQEEAAEGEQVGVDHPGERRLREAEILPDRRQRDAHDRHVEDDHQVAQAEDDQRQPAVPVRLMSLLCHRLVFILRPVSTESSLGAALRSRHRRFRHPDVENVSPAPTTHVTEQPPKGVKQ